MQLPGPQNFTMYDNAPGLFPILFKSAAYFGHSLIISLYRVKPFDTALWIWTVFLVCPAIAILTGFTDPSGFSV
jgi:hypothetical protein